MRILIPFLILSILMWASCVQQPPSASDLSTFELQEGFELSLVAAEPLVMDPVAMEIDEWGNFYVVEMPGYPLDVSGSGRVIMLKDTDGDGLPDKREIFADGLTLPNGIMRWKEGIIVTDAPDVLYLVDTNGDGRADQREVLLTGFSRSNPQHNMNSPKFGLDNWIYLGHEGAFITKTFVEEFGGRGTHIHFPTHPDGPQLPQNAHGHAVRFQPDQHKVEMLSGSTQFGYTFDRWGHIFYNSNAHHLFHEVIAARYVKGKQHLPLRSAEKYLPTYGPGAEIYPITEQPEHQVLTDVGTITSACGLTLYQGGSFPAAYDQVTFTAEPVHNLVHTARILEDGASFAAARQFEQSEFLASKDSWFRPVNFYMGPKGELYVLDYHRQYIEHPEWMAKEVVESGQLYNGIDKGRIYKISSISSPSSSVSLVANTSDQEPFPPISAAQLGSLSATDLVPLLAHENIWWRRNVQRLLIQHAPHRKLKQSDQQSGHENIGTQDENGIQQMVENEAQKKGQQAIDGGVQGMGQQAAANGALKNDPQLVKDNSSKGLREIGQVLRDFALHTSSDVGLLHAMWTMEGLGLFDVEVLKRAFTHEEAGIKENALKIWEKHPEIHVQTWDELLSLQYDSHPKVRFQLLSTLSLISSSGNRLNAESIVQLVQALLMKDVEDNWVQFMALAASEGSEYALIRSIVKEATPAQREGVVAFVEKASEMIGRKADEATLQSMIWSSVQVYDEGKDYWKSAMLKGLAKGIEENAAVDVKRYEYEKGLLLEQFEVATPATHRSACLALLETLGLPQKGQAATLLQAKRVLAQHEAASSYKLDAVRLIGLGDPTHYRESLTALFEPTEAVDVQVAALKVLHTIDYAKFPVDTFIFHHWNEFTTTLQQEALRLLTQKEATAWKVLAQVESGALHPANISWPTKLRLLNHRHDSLKLAARALLVVEQALTEEALAQYSEAIQAEGNTELGASVFSTNCSSCHQMAGKGGIAYGPDLAAIRNRTRSAILHDILFPNKAIADGFGIWQIDLVNGAQVFGIIAEERNDQLLLRDASGQEIAIDRKDIQQLLPMEKSGMPEGLAQQISVDEMKNLLAYLKNPN